MIPSASPAQPITLDTNGEELKNAGVTASTSSVTVRTQPLLSVSLKWYVPGVLIEASSS